MAKILVVDDHPQIVRLLQRVLQTHAHEVIAASDGEEALKKEELLPLSLRGHQRLFHRSDADAGIRGRYQVRPEL